MNDTNFTTSDIGSTINFAIKYPYNVHEITLAEWLSLCFQLDPKTNMEKLELMTCLYHQGYFMVPVHEFIVDV